MSLTAGACALCGHVGPLAESRNGPLLCEGDAEACRARWAATNPPKLARFVCLDCGARRHQLAFDMTRETMEAAIRSAACEACGSRRVEVIASGAAVHGQADGQ